jgi:hypothetical protein
VLPALETLFEAARGNRLLFLSANAVSGEAAFEASKV